VEGQSQSDLDDTESMCGNKRKSLNRNNGGVGVDENASGNYTSAPHSMVRITAALRFSVNI